MMDLFLRGGLLFMLPLLAASIALVAIGIERTVRFRRAEIVYADFLAEIRQLLQEEGVASAHEYARTLPGPVARVWDEGLDAYRLPFPLIRERMESAAIDEVSRLERHIGHLSVVASLAPLVGILGTVWGMIVSFQVLEGGLAAGAGLAGETLAGGIWKALVTTAAGLIVAIGASLVHHYLRHRVERFVEALERSIPDLIASLVPLRARAGEPVVTKVATARAAQ